ncbi:MAG: LTA synthase family protein [Bacteroidia bacterium]
MQNYTRHIRLRLIQLSILPLLYFLCRLLFYVFNHSLFRAVSLSEFSGLCIAGLRFDISAILMLNSPFLFLALLPLPHIGNKWWQMLLKGVYLLVNGLGLAANCLDMGYFRFTLRRLRWDFLHTMQHGNDFAPIRSYLLGYWHISLVFALLFWALIYFYNRAQRKTTGLNFVYAGIPAFLANFMAFLVIGAVCTLGIRGGFQTSPLSLSHAGDYAKPSTIPLVLNSPFSFIQSHAQSRLTGHHYFSEQECTRIFTPVHPPSAHPLCKLNVVFLILESFSKEYTGLSGLKSYTPFLDSLMQHAYVFTNAYSNGKRSAEGIPAILSGIPSLLDEGYPASAYAGNETDALPSLLKTLGYNTAFFHGGNPGTMNFDSYARLSGFDSYYGRQEYNNDLDYDGNWGIWDEPFLQFFAGKLNQMQEPFCASVFTLSSHDPFRVPEKYENRFPLGNRTINPCIGYADFALRRFFNTASKTPWFDHTLFIICPDHTGYSDDAFWGNNAGQYQIPLLFYRHDKEMRGRDSTLVQQIDIAPTVLNLLGYSNTFFAFGNNALDTLSPHFAVNYRNNVYQLFQGPYLLQFDGEKVKGFYNIGRDSLLTNNLQTSGLPDQIQMENFLKAYLQCYEQCMIRNKMKYILAHE